MVNYAGFLSEGQATNKALYCRDFTNAAWVKTNIAASLTETGITGVANSCSSLTASSANGTAFQTIITASANYTTSFYVKRKTGTGIVSITDNNGTNYTDITSQINTTSFTRIQISRTQANPVIGFKLNTSSDSIIVDFSQTEEGAFATSPILTTSVAVTRSQDNAVADVNQKPWFNAKKGTLLVDFKRLKEIETSSIAMQADDGSNNNVIQIGQDTEANNRQFFARVVTGGVEQVKLTTIESGLNNKAIAAFAYKDNDFAFCVNGGEVKTASTGTLPASLSAVRIGKDFSNSLYGNIKSSRTFLGRETNESLQLLTKREITKQLIVEGVIVEDSIDYACSTTSTYYNSGGLVAYAAINEPRLHYLQDNSDDFGLLIEEARTNLMIQSSIGGAGWTLNGGATRTGGAFNSPDGTANATQLTMAASTSSGIFITASVAVTTVPHTFSYFIKKVSGTGKFLFLGSTTVGAWGGSGNFIATFNTETGIVTSVGSSITASKVTTLPNGWFRVQITGTPIANTTTTNLILNAEALTGVYGVFGVQVEAGSFATTLIPTTGTALTRAAPTCKITDISLQDWFNSLKGTFYCDFKRYSNVIDDSYAFEIDSGSASNLFFAGQSATTKLASANISKDAIVQFTAGLSTLDQNRRNRIAFAYEKNNSQFAANGQITAIDTSCDIPNKMISFSIGYGIEAGHELNGIIRTLGYENKRVAGEQLFFATLDENGSVVIGEGAGQITLSLVYIKDNLGYTRTYIKEVPTGTAKGLLVIAHGGGGTGATIRDGTNFDIDLKSQFVCIYPYARYNPYLGLTTFNAGGTLFEVPGASDDVDFFDRMVTDVITVENAGGANKIDVSKISVWGISNGGMMGHRYCSEAYRLNFTYKPINLIAVSSVVTQNIGINPYEFTGNLLTINCKPDVIVPEAGTLYYRSWADSEAIYDPVVSSDSEYIVTINGGHGLTLVRDGLALNSTPWDLQQLTLAFINQINYITTDDGSFIGTDSGDFIIAG